MKNPWEEISLDDYENHMSLDSVNQLQTMNAIMKAQFEDYQTETAMILGIAGGNGLEHISSEKYRKVYGIDINKEYLRTVSERYAYMGDVLECLQLDIVSEPEKLPEAQFVVANLLIEYTGYQAFQRAVLRTGAEYVSCLIQINTDAEKWVSDSPYLHKFDRLDEVHHQMEEKELENAMAKTGYSLILKKTEPLPDGKAMTRLDFRKKKVIGPKL